MTFAVIKARIQNHCNLSSTESDTRIGIAVNAHYRRVTSLCGLETARWVTRSANTTTTVRTVTFSSIEQIERITDATTATAIRTLDPVSVDEIRETQSVDAAPTKWAIQSRTATGVTIVMDTAPTAVYALQADGWSNLSDLTSNDVPVIPESFHDILVHYGIAEELMRKEKPQLAMIYSTGDMSRPGKAENMLAALQFYLADNPRLVTRQGDRLRG